ncbi:hypothetical protein [Leifsonia sp. NPDC058248]|uniref:hypothetical protein n=1 Tax=Leifsonia sp. NPDC058248 TaxID=3346402 RepID=UPI0036D8A031
MTDTTTTPPGKFVVAPDPALGADELYKGASATGNLVLAIPADGKGLIRVTPGILAKDVFIATN